MDDAPMFREIEIRGSLMPQEVPPGTRIGNGLAVIKRSVSAASVLAAIDDAERAGLRAILLVIEGEGGELEAGCRVYNRIRKFSDAGGRVVAFVQGRAASTLPLIAAGADLVLMRWDAKLILHSAHNASGVCSRSNGVQARILHERTGMALERLRVYLSDIYLCSELHDQAAVHAGWADIAPATLEQARSFARILGQGAQIAQLDTPRIRRLAGKPSAPVDATEIPAGVAASHQVQSSDGGYAGTPCSVDIRNREIALSNMTLRSTSMGWEDVAYGPAGFIVVGGGDSYCLSYSGDDDFSTSGTIASGATFHAICYDAANDRYIAVGNSAACYVTTNGGATWTSKTIPSGNFFGVVVHGTKLVATGVTAGGSPVVSLSSDGGDTWSSATAPTLGTYGGVTSPASDGSTLAVVGAGKLYYSTDDAGSWTEQTLPDLATGETIYVVRWGPGYWVAGGTADKAWQGAPGGSWVNRPLPRKMYLGQSGLLCAENVWLAFEAMAESRASAVMSHDGLLWAPRPLVSPGGFRSGAWSGFRACLVGYGIATSQVV